MEFAPEREAPLKRNSKTVDVFCIVSLPYDRCSTDGQYENISQCQIT